MGKLLAFKAYWHAAESCLQRHGSFGYAREYDAEHMLGMPRLL